MEKETRKLIIGIFGWTTFIFIVGFVSGSLMSDSNHVIDINTNNETVESLRIMTETTSRVYGSCSEEYLMEQFDDCVIYNGGLKGNIIPDDCNVIFDYAYLVSRLDDLYSNE